MAASARRIIFLLLAACALPLAAAPARALDQIRIHAYYHDGEFDKVIRELEAFQKSGRACSHAESLFVEKHLAVVYAANPGTRELGRYHMFRILDLAPTSDLLDMFVGEEVGSVFEKVGKEYALRNAAKSAMARANPKNTPNPARAAPSSATARTLSAAAPSARARPANVHPSSGSNHDSSASANGAGASTPAWKEPGLWIGGGAALAVVAFTLFYSGSESAAPQSKTYVVPASASR